MKAWMLPWVVPVALVATVVLVTILKEYAAFAAVIAGWILVPVLWRLHVPADEDADTKYWRFGRR